jgi:hypothetical protein
MGRRGVHWCERAQPERKCDRRATCDELHPASYAACHVPQSLTPLAGISRTTGKPWAAAPEDSRQLIRVDASRRTVRRVRACTLSLYGRERMTWTRSRIALVAVCTAVMLGIVLTAVASAKSSHPANHTHTVSTAAVTGVCAPATRRHHARVDRRHVATARCAKHRPAQRRSRHRKAKALAMTA